MQTTSLKKLNKLLALELIAHGPALGTRTSCLLAVLPALRPPGLQNSFQTLTAASDGPSDAGGTVHHNSCTESNASSAELARRLG